jgi:hypothetical protein
MGQLVISQESGITAPVAGKTAIYADPADSGRVKAIQPDGSIQQLSASGLRDRNFLMNPEFAIAQRQVPTTLTTYSSTTARVYAADRWAMVNSVASLQFHNVDNIAAPIAGVRARFIGEFKQITNPGKHVIMQWLDGTDSTELAGQIVRFQFKARNGAAGAATLRLGMLYLAAAGTVDTPPATIASAFGVTGVDPTWGTNLAVVSPIACEASGVIANHGSAAVDCVLTAAFQRFSATFLVPPGANIKNLVPVIWTSTIPATNDLYQITECGLYVGTDIRDFYPRSFGDELLACQRFYSKSFPLAIAPAASVTVANGGYGATSIINRTGSGTAAAVQIPIQFPVRMAKVPTLTFFTPVAAGAVAYRFTGGTPAAQGTTAINTNATTDLGSSVTVTEEATANAAIGDLVGVHWTADADI